MLIAVGLRLRGARADALRAWVARTIPHHLAEPSTPRKSESSRKTTRDPERTKARHAPQRLPSIRACRKRSPTTARKSMRSSTSATMLQARTTRTRTPRPTWRRSECDPAKSRNARETPERKASRRSSSTPRKSRHYTRRSWSSSPRRARQTVPLKCRRALGFLSRGVVRAGNGGAVRRTGGDPQGRGGDQAAKCEARRRAHRPSLTENVGGMRRPSQCSSHYCF